MLMQPRAVLLDMDGLMFDTERLICRAWQIAAQEAGLSFSDAIVHSVVGLDRAGTREVLLPHLEGVDYDTLRVRRIEITARLLERGGIPFRPGLQAFLARAKDLSLRLAVVTATERSRTGPMLEQAGLTCRFDAVVCGDEVQNGKPDPEIYQLAAVRLSLPSAACIALEDSSAGVIAAHTAGMRTIAIPDLAPLSQAARDAAFACCVDLNEAALVLSALFQ